MKIPVHYSLKVARQVVSKIDLPKEIAENCEVKSYSNGREQGLFIYRFGFDCTQAQALTVAQQRSSDEILVVIGAGIDFDVATNSPSEKLWERDGSKNYFRYDEVDKAAKFIEEFLKKN